MSKFCKPTNSKSISSYSGPEYEERYIELFEFNEADRKYRKLSNSGGDEDWIALVPPGVRDAVWFWEDNKWCSPLGWCQEHKLSNGLTVFIFHHS